MKAEVYYQHLFDVPVETVPGSTNSFVNYADIWEMIFAEQTGNEGKGRNYGLDLTLEKFFTRSYIHATGSAYRSLYTPVNGKEYSTASMGATTCMPSAARSSRLAKTRRTSLASTAKRCSQVATVHAD